MRRIVFMLKRRLEVTRAVQGDFWYIVADISLHLRGHITCICIYSCLSGGLHVNQLFTLLNDF